jgi:hypothetical protein
MRLLRILFNLLGLAVGLPLGGLLLYLTIELKAVTQKTQPTPQRLPAAKLAEKGAPDNLYIELTGFTFGKPVIEKNEEGWVGAWLPVEPTSQPKEAARYSIFVRANVRDQAGLDALLKQSRCEALVTTGLPKTSRWRVKSGPALRKAYPELDLSQVLFLAEPRLSLLGHSVELSDPRLYDPMYESLGAWGGTGLVLFGLVNFYWLIKRRRTAVDAGLDTEALRAQLETERPESVHTARTSGVVQGVLGFGILAGIFLCAVLLLTVAAIRAQGEGKPSIAVLMIFLDVPFILAARAAVRACVRRFRWPTDIALCPTGVRWRQGSKRRAILWAEFAEVHREVKIIPRVGQTGLVGAFQQLNNPMPPLIKDTVRITLHSGETYLMSPAMVTNYNGFAESAPTLWKEDGLRHDSACVTDAWLKSLRKERSGQEEKGNKTYHSQGY